MFREVGFAPIVKPVSETLTGAELESGPLIPVPVPVTVTVYWPGETEVCVKTVKVAVAEPPRDRCTIVGLMFAPGPPETPVVRVTLPLNPLRLVMVIADVAEEPDGKVSVVGLAVMRKSGGVPTVIVMLVEWESRPLVPITVTE